MCGVGGPASQAWRSGSDSLCPQNNILMAILMLLRELDIEGLEAVMCSKIMKFSIHIPESVWKIQK